MLSALSMLRLSLAVPSALSGKHSVRVKRAGGIASSPSICSNVQLEPLALIGKHSAWEQRGGILSSLSFCRNVQFAKTVKCRAWKGSLSSTSSKGFVCQAVDNGIEGEGGPLEGGSKQEKNLYEVLGVSPTTTEVEIKQAYRRCSLETHPDRFPAGSQEQENAFDAFQEVNGAYYVLSDPERRREYDKNLASGMGQGGEYGSLPPPPQELPAKANKQFKQEFFSTIEKMMREEGITQAQPLGGVWAMAGVVAGILLGYILASSLGALLGAVAGFMLGRIRDVRKKDVYEVFQELPDEEKSRLLSGLLVKVVAKMA